MPLHAQCELAPIRSAHEFENLTRGVLDIGGGLPVNIDDTVTWQESGNITWACWNRTFDINRIIEHDENDADVRYDAVVLYSRRLGGPGVKVAGVRIQFAQYFKDTVVNKHVKVHSVNILLGNEVEDGIDLWVAVGVRFGCQELTVNKDSRHQCK